MSRPRRFLVLTALVALARPAGAQDAAPARPANEDPVLRLEGDGPLSPVSALAFGRGGETLYEAGWDKVVRVWRRGKDGRFATDPASSLRTPIGPGESGVLNALAVSADGRWLAAGGNAVLPGGAGFRQVGLVVPRASAGATWDQGTIYVFDLQAQPPACRQIPAHRGPVVALAFAATPPGARPLLASLRRPRTRRRGAGEPPGAGPPPLGRGDEGTEGCRGSSPGRTRSSAPGWPPGRRERGRGRIRAAAASRHEFLVPRLGRRAGASMARRGSSTRSRGSEPDLLAERLSKRGRRAC